MDQKILRLFSSKWMRCTQHLSVHFLAFLHLFNSRWMRAHSTCVFVFWYLQILTFSRLSSSPHRLFAWARECTLKYHFDWLINIFQRYLKKKSPRSTATVSEIHGMRSKTRSHFTTHPHASTWKGEGQANVHEPDWGHRQWQPWLWLWS